jgi:hypothetical protein
MAQSMGDGTDVVAHDNDHGCRKMSQVVEAPVLVDPGRLPGLPLPPPDPVGIRRAPATAANRRANPARRMRVSQRSTSPTPSRARGVPAVAPFWARRTRLVWSRRLAGVDESSLCSGHPSWTSDTVRPAAPR